MNKITRNITHFLDISLLYFMVKTDVIIITIFNAIVSIILRTPGRAFIPISNGILYVYIGTSR